MLPHAAGGYQCPADRRYWCWEPPVPCLVGGLSSPSAYGATPGSVSLPCVPASRQPHSPTAGDNAWQGQGQVVLPAELFLCPVGGYQPVLKELPRSAAVWCLETECRESSAERMEQIAASQCFRARWTPAAASEPDACTLARPPHSWSGGCFEQGRTALN